MAFLDRLPDQNQAQSETNPYNPEVPAVIQQQAPELHEYLVQLTDTVRTQHNKSQAGDTSFPWQVLTALDSTPTYTLGSKGKFAHPEFGAMQGLYVQFDSIGTSGTESGVGVFVRRGTWLASNRLDKSEDKIPRGIIAAYALPTDGVYGWLLTGGVNLVSLRLTGAKPTKGDWVTLEDDGTLSASGKSARVVGQVLDSTIVIAGTSGWLIGAGGLRLDLSDSGFVVSRTLAAGQTALTAALAFGDQIVELRQSLELVDGQNRTSLDILSRRVTSLTKDRASVEYTEILSAAANYANLAANAAQISGVNAGITKANLEATNEFVRSAKVYRDESGYYAESLTRLTNEAAVNTNLSSSNAFVTIEYAAQASDSAASARSSAELAASYSSQGAGGNLVANSTFLTTDGWILGGNLTYTQAGIDIAGPNYHIPGEHGISVYQGNNGGLGLTGYLDWKSAPFGVIPGTYMQCYAYYNAHRAPTEVYLAWLNSEGNEFAYAESNIAPSLDVLGNQLSNYVQLGVKAALVPAGAVGARLCLRKYDTLAGQADSYAWFTRPFVTVTRAGQDQWIQYGPGNDGPGLVQTNARVTSESVASVNRDGALGSRIDTVTANYQAGDAALGGQITTVDGRVTSEITARANADGALGSRIDTVTAGYTNADAARRADIANLGTDITNANSRITSEATASANRDGALGSRIDTVTANYQAGDATLTASVTAQGTAIAGIQANYATYSVVVAASGSNPAQVRLYAGSGGSIIEQVADKIRLANFTAGTVRTAIEVVGGNTTFYGDVSALGAMTFGTRRIPLALQSFTVTAADGESVSFGGNLVNIPKFIFDSSGLSALSSGQSYSLKALNVSPTGFTMSAKKIVPATVVLFVDTGDSANGSSTTPRLIMQKGSTIDAFDGNYTPDCSLRVIPDPGSFDGTYYYGTATLTFYINTGGGWVYVGAQNIDYQVSNAGANFIDATATFYYASPVGQNAGAEWGVGYGGDAIDVNQFRSLEYQGYSGSTSEVTASPNGEKATIIVIPQNQ